MLSDLAAIVRTELVARGCPMPVIYGPERAADVSLVRSRIVIERPRERGDDVTPPRHKGVNPFRRAERGIAGVARVYASSTADGARVQDHEVIADHAIDLVIIALQIAAARLSTTITFGAGGFVDADSLELGDLTTWPGVVYELDFVARRGVFDRTWALESRTEQTDFSITTSGTCVMTVAPEE